ncbi:MAG: peptidase domain-containing ABC transporter [Clostridium sp.]|nr:peptidase domain-containing ABC transporter [Clostridium sp.]
MKYPHIQQHDERDCGAACLSMIAEYYGAKYKTADIRRFIKVDIQGTNFIGLMNGAKMIGLEGEALDGDFSELSDGVKSGEITFPFIARIINEIGYEHFIVIYKFNSKTLTIGDPSKGKITKISIDVFKSQWQGQIMTFTKNKDFVTVNERKGSFKKFFRYITMQKKMLIYVFIISMFITLINMSGVTVFQYVIDETIYNEELYENEHHDDHEDKEVQEDEVIEDSEEDKMSAVDEILSSVMNKIDIVFKNLKTVCITVILLYLFQCFINILRGYMLSLTAKKVDVPLTLDYYDHLMDLPADFYGAWKTGEYMSRFGDTENIREAVSTTTLTIMLDTIMAIGCGVFLIYINHTLFLITAVVIIVYAIIMFSFKNPIKNINHEIMENEAKVTSYLKESIDGVETIKAYGYGPSAKNKTHKLYNDFADKNVKAALIYITQESFVSAIESIGVVILLGTGALLCGKNIIDLSDLFIFYYLIGYFIDPVKNLINLQPELQTAMVAAERLNDILDADIEDNQKQEISSMNGDIKVNNIDFRYGYRELVLKDISMKFKSGTKTAIVGETGCGKTTLVKLLMSFDKPENGSITVGKKDIRQFSPDSIRKKISYISQDIFLFSDSIYNNLRMGNENISDDEIKGICQQCGIDDFINSMPMGYDTVLEENGNNLSGGQKQRLAIARALLRNPDVLIMDEATSNLDTVTENSMKALIENFSDKMTCIIIAHRLNTIKNCDYIYVMDKGQIAEKGTHQELLEQNGLYVKFVNQQLHM